MTKRKNKQYLNEFKQEALELVIEQDYSIVKAATPLGITNKVLYAWVTKYKKES